MNRRDELGEWLPIIGVMLYVGLFALVAWWIGA